MNYTLNLSPRAWTVSIHHWFGMVCFHFFYLLWSMTLWWFFMFIFVLWYRLGLAGLSTWVSIFDNFSIMWRNNAASSSQPWGCKIMKKENFRLNISVKSNSMSFISIDCSTILTKNDNSTTILTKNTDTLWCCNNWFDQNYINIIVWNSLGLFIEIDLEEPWEWPQSESDYISHNQKWVNGTISVV